MHNVHVRRALAVAVALASAACGRKDAQVSRAFEVHDAWVRAADSGATTAAYMRLTNGGDAPVTVSGFQTEVARVTELHESSMDHHMMASMTPKDSVVVAPKAHVELKPGGYHLMVIGTTRALQPGEHVRITMRLSSGAIVAANAAVRGR